MAGKYNYLVGIFFCFILLSYSHSASATIMVAPPPLHNPVIIIPGLLGSFNPIALIADKPGGEWIQFPLYDVYAGLVKRFKLAGYIQNQDLFVAYYDWRKPNAESAHNFLAPMIKEAEKQTGQVDIVAHSMGGLVAQAYINSDDYTPGEIGKLVMLGTPNEGASEVYLPWEGGVLPKSWNFVFQGYVNWIEGALATANKVPNIKNPAGYREFFPSLKELLPSQPFLIKNGGDTKLSDVDINPILQSLHDNFGKILGDNIAVTTIAGNGEQTIGTIALTGDRTDADKALDRWRDGHPTEEVPNPNTDAGDSTVLKSSALLGINDVTVDGVTHINLPEKAQNEIFTALGISDSHDKQFIYQAPKSLFGLAVLSPVSVVITDPSGKKVSKDINDYGDDAYISISPDISSDDPKVIILRNVPSGIYTVNLTGIGAGEYHVVLTYGNENGGNTSETLTGTTTLGKQESFTVKINDSGADISEIKNDSPPSGGGSGFGDHPRGDEGDCCAGHDPVSPLKKHPKVLGASTTKLGKVTLEELTPLNDTFFSVYHRVPTFEEWKYWAYRYEHDKRDWKQIYGAMCWHFAREI